MTSSSGYADYNKLSILLFFVSPNPYLDIRSTKWYCVYRCV